MKDKILYIPLGDHYFHRWIFEKLSKELNLDKEEFKKNDKKFSIYNKTNFYFEKILKILKNPKDYKIILTEGTYAIPCFFRIFGLLKNTKIINIAADNAYDWNVKKRKNSAIQRLIRKSLLKKVDYFIAVSEKVKQNLKKINIKKGIFVLHPFIKKNRITPFKKIKYNPKSNNIICIGSYDYYYKGIDNNIKVFKKVKSFFPKFNLIILGKFYNLDKISNELNEEGIYTKGWVSNLKKYFSDSLFCLHLSRGDSFPVSTIETSLAGIPTFISNSTGTLEIFQKISEEFVLDENKLEDEILKVLKFINLSKDKKLNLSQKFKYFASHYNEENSNIEVNKIIKRLKQVVW